MAQPSPEPESFTKMDSADLDALGAHCQFPYCHQLDFLPFQCDSCKQTFCLDHRSETSHKCPKAGEWAKKRRQNSVGAGNRSSSGPTLSGLTPTECFASNCKTVIHTLQHTGSRCDRCNRQYCLKHRLQEDHDCKNVAPLGARQSNGVTPTSALETQAEKVRQGFSRLRAWGKDKQTSLKPKPRSAPTTPSQNSPAALAALRKSAKGDLSLPANKRLYLHVEAEQPPNQTSTVPSKSHPIFFSVDWSIGRMLDDAAKRLQISNVNNRAEGEGDRLRIYHVEGGKVLGFSEKLGAVNGLKNGDTIVLLRGVEGLEGA